MVEVPLGFLTPDGVPILTGTRIWIELHAVKSRVTETPGVLCGNSVDAEAEPRIRPRLKILEDIGMCPDYIGQEFRIAHPSHPRFLLAGRKAREVILFVLVQAT